MGGLAILGAILCCFLLTIYFIYCYYFMYEKDWDCGEEKRHGLGGGVGGGDRGMELKVEGAKVGDIIMKKSIIEYRFFNDGLCFLNDEHQGGREKYIVTCF